MEHILEQLKSHSGTLLNQLQEAVNKLETPQQKAEYNAWLLKIKDVFKLPLNEQTEAIAKLQNEFINYK